MRVSPSVEERLSAPYFRCLRYRGHDGTRVQLEFERTSLKTTRGQWWWRLHGSQWEYGPYRDKLAAVIDCANSRGRSGEAMDWEPER